MPDSDSVLEDDGLTWVHVKAAQVLDVARCADDYLVLVRPEYRSVPDAREWPDAHGANDDGAGRDPGVLVDRGNNAAKGADHDRTLTSPTLLAALEAALEVASR